MEDAPSRGRIVHWIAPGGEHLAAIVSDVAFGNAVNLHVFPPASPCRVVTTVLPDKNCQRPGTWHWPEKGMKIQVSSFKFQAAAALLLLACIAGAMSLRPPTGEVSLEWDYPEAALSTNLSFNIYATTNITLPLTNWSCITNVAGTNKQVTVRIQPGQMFFVATASNFWGESLTSNVASTPPLPLPPDDSLTIKRADQ